MRFFCFTIFKLLCIREKINSNTEEYLEYRGIAQQDPFYPALIFVYRIGAHIVLPGIDPDDIQSQMANAKNGILGLIDTFAGGAFSQASIFALGIMPYISASIFMQLMTVLVPQFQKLQKEGDSGRKKINQWTRYLTVAVTIVQASAYVSLPE